MSSTTARRVTWGVITTLSMLTAGYAVFLVVTGFAFVPEDIADNQVLQPIGIRVHIAASAIALLAGPWQFAAGLRRRAPLVHRTMGRVYLIGCLVGGGAGALIALGTTSGPTAGVGFLLMAITWLATSVMAYVRIRSRDVAGHRRWMTRSFAAIFAAVTLRVQLGVCAAIGLPFDDFYPWIAWLSWVPNMIVAEWWIRTRLPGVRTGA